MQCQQTFSLCNLKADAAADDLVGGARQNCGEAKDFNSVMSTLISSYPGEQKDAGERKVFAEAEPWNPENETMEGLPSDSVAAEEKPQAAEGYAETGGAPETDMADLNNARQIFSGRILEKQTSEPKNSKAEDNHTLTGRADMANRPGESAVATAQDAQTQSAIATEQAENAMPPHPISDAENQAQIEEKIQADTLSDTFASETSLETAATSNTATDNRNAIKVFERSGAGRASFHKAYVSRGMEQVSADRQNSAVSENTIQGDAKTDNEVNVGLRDEGGRQVASSRGLNDGGMRGEVSGTATKSSSTFPSATATAQTRGESSTNESSSGSLIKAPAADTVHVKNTAQKTDHAHTAATSPSRQNRTNPPSTDSTDRQATDADVSEVKITSAEKNHYFSSQGKAGSIRQNGAGTESAAANGTAINLKNAESVQDVTAAAKNRSLSSEFNGGNGSSKDQAGRNSDMFADNSQAEKLFMISGMDKAAFSVNLKTTADIQTHEVKGTNELPLEQILTRTERLQEFVSRFDEHLMAMTYNKSNSMTINLTPPNLGKIMLNCSESGGEISIGIVAQNAHVREFVSDHEKFIRELVEGNGWKLAEFDVTTQDREGQQYGNFHREATDWEEQRLEKQAAKSAEKSIAKVQAGASDAGGYGMENHNGLWIVA